ncbi:MAG TPA: DUF4145 domain-containing protein [Candidatus Helicobacter avistercoris]|nr:DUF4145 domain-containing protein [Candidatus Helicobacter avistercoris]
MEKYAKPEFDKIKFTCPYCGVFSQIKWHKDKALEIDNHYTEELDIGYCFAQCECCQGVMCFSYKLLSEDIDPYDGLIQKFNSTILYPKQIGISPAKDMPEHIKKTYKEASLVFGDSPRASCALLRLALQELMIYLRDNHGDYGDLKGKKIDEDIGILVKNHTLPAKIQKALDSVRIIGNNAVHPKELDINDNPNIAETLFKMINFIIEEMITKPKEIEDIYGKMPEKERGWVVDRDKNKSK